MVRAWLELTKEEAETRSMFAKRHVNRIYTVGFVSPCSHQPSSIRLTIGQEEQPQVKSPLPGAKSTANHQPLAAPQHGVNTHRDDTHHLECPYQRAFPGSPSAGRELLLPVPDNCIEVFGVGNKRARTDELGGSDENLHAVYRSR